MDPQHLVARYVGLWNEPSPGVRRGLIAELWSEHGRHVLQPPPEMRQVAAVGLEVLVLDDDDRIRVDYQFIEP